MATKAQQIKFINEIGPIAQRIAREYGYGNAQVWTCIAQACNESAYGCSTLMKKANAFFGIKANQCWIDQAKYGGLVYNAGTKECYDGKTYVGITACFRAYKSMEDSVRDYYDLLAYNRYKACLNKTNVKDCISAIKAGGYATAPEYVNTILSFYNSNKELIDSFAVTNIVAPTVVIKSVEEIAYECIRGYWGNGVARKAKLITAGYNYTEVQSTINKILRGV